MTAKYRVEFAGAQLNADCLNELDWILEKIEYKFEKGPIITMTNLITGEKAECPHTGVLKRVVKTWREEARKTDQIRTKICGQIEIDVEEGTVSLSLENGSHCTRLYTAGIERFLREEIKYTRQDNFKIRQQNKPLARRR